MTDLLIQTVGLLAAGVAGWSAAKLHTSRYKTGK